MSRERSIKASFWMLGMAAVGLVLLLCSGVYAGGWAYGNDDPAYVEGMWDVTLVEDSVMPDLKESVARSRFYLLGGDLEKKVYEGGWMEYSSSVTVFDRDGKTVIGQGTFYLRPSLSRDGNNIFLSFYLNEDPSNGLYCRIFYSPKVMKGKCTSDIWGAKPLEFSNGKITLKR